MGFIFKKLRVSGHDVRNAEIEFTDGLNVITGPSDTGKTYIYQCINFMLGSRKAPKPLDQANSYDRIFLEIETFDHRNFTIESSLKGGNFKLYESKLDDITASSKNRVVARKHSSINEDNISAFFLKLTNVKDVKLRKNNLGAKSDLSYRDVAKFLLVDETYITTDKSPIVGDEYISATKQKSLLKYLITGQDDSKLVEGLSKDQITNRKGRIEVLDELINDLKIQLLNHPINFEETLISLEEQIENISETVKSLKSYLLELDSKKKSLTNDLSEKKSQEMYYNELLFRSGILKRQYSSDIDRLRATIEASLLLVSGHSFDGQCPLCKSNISSNCTDQDIQQIIHSCELEINKIIPLFSEAYKTDAVITDEINKVKQLITVHEFQLDQTVDEIDNSLISKISESLNRLDALNLERNKLIEAKFINNNIKNLVRQKESIDNYLQSNVSFDEVSTSIMTPLCNKMKEVLLGSNYPVISSVAFSEKKTDFVISGQDRELSGKGFRAITYSAFIVAIQELLTENNRFIGVPVLDSPLVTYKPNKDSKDNEGTISDNLAMDFYRYVAKSKKIRQIIIIENDLPPKDIMSDINFIGFTKSENDGRYGFFPV